MKEFKVGDKVCMYGKVTEDNGPDSTYPITVIWDDSTLRTYTYNGSCYKNRAVTIFAAKEESTVLASQADCWRALVAGYSLRSKFTGNVYKFENGSLYNTSLAIGSAASFTSYTAWEIAPEVAPEPIWQDELATKDILCKVWDYSDDSTRYTRYITQYTSTKPIPYADIAGDLWQYAEPIPSEDLAKDKQ